MWHTDENNNIYYSSCSMARGQSPVFLLFSVDVIQRKYQPSHTFIHTQSTTETFHNYTINLTHCKIWQLMLLFLLKAVSFFVHILVCDEMTIKSPPKPARRRPPELKTIRTWGVIMIFSSTSCRVASAAVCRFITDTRPPPQ